MCLHNIRARSLMIPKRHRKPSETQGVLLLLVPAFLWASFSVLLTLKTHFLYNSAH